MFSTRNWVQSAVTSVLPEWSGTASGSDPGFRDLVQRNFSPLATSHLRNAGVNRPPSPVAFPMPWPLLLVRYDPPQRAHPQSPTKTVMPMRAMPPSFV